MKTVFDNSMVAHVWNAQRQPEGRSANHNFYFHGRVLLSYGRHYVVGIIMPDGAALLNSDSHSVSTSRHCREAWAATRNRTQLMVPGLTEIEESLLNLDRSDSYGLERLPGRRQAIESHVRNHEMPDESALYLLKLIGSRNPARTLRRLRKEAARAAAKRAAAEKRRTRESRLAYAARISRTPTADLIEWRNGLDSYSGPRAARDLYHVHRAAKGAGRTRQAADVWSLLTGVRGHMAALERKAARSNMNRHLRSTCADIRRFAAAHAAGEMTRAYDYRRFEEAADWLLRHARAIGGLARGTFESIRTAAHAERDRLALLEEAARFEREKADRESWLNGAGPRYWRGSDATGGAMLRAMGVERDESGRIIGGTLQTSHGADVPLTHAIKAFRFLKFCRESGTAWHSNGRTVRVGHFQIDSIDPEGNFRAGCHSINWPETERIARQLGVFDGPADDSAVSHIA